MAEARKIVLDYDINNEALKAARAEMDAFKDSTNESEKAVAKVNKELEEQLKLERQQGQEIKKLQTRLQELVALQQKTTDKKRIKEYNTEIANTQKALQALNQVEKGRLATIKKLQTEQEKLGKITKKTTDSSAKSFRGLLDNVSDTVPQVDSLKGLLTGLGRATVPTAIIAGVAAIGFEAAQVAIQLSKIAERIQGLTGLTKEQSLQQAGAIKALADTYGIDLQTAITAANTASKNFGVDFGTAVEQINEGLAGGLRFSEEYLENLKEYPSALGLTITSLEDFNALILLQQQEGFFNDKLVDTVKEFEISIRELTKPTREAFGQAGLAGALDQFEKKQISATDLLQLTGKRMKELGVDSKETGVLLADVFRGAGEDSVQPLIRVFSDFQGKLAETKQTAEELGQAERNLFDAQTKLNNALASENTKGFLDFLTNAKAGLIEFSANFINATSSAERFFNFVTSRGASENVIAARAEKEAEAEERLTTIRDKSVIIQQRLARLRGASLGAAKVRVDLVERETEKLQGLGSASADQVGKIKALDGQLLRLEKRFGTLPVKPEIDIVPDPAQLEKEQAELKQKIKEAARNEELRLRLIAQIEIEAAGGSGTESGLNLQELFAQENFAEQAVKLKLDSEAINQGILNIEKDFAAKRQALRDQQTEKAQADREKANADRITSQKAAFDSAINLATEQLAIEEELAQRRLLVSMGEAGTDLEAQARAAEQFQQESFDAELRFLDNVKLVKQTANLDTIEEAKRVNDILLEIQENRLEAEINKEMEATEKKRQIRDALLNGASQIANAISQVVQQNLDKELAAVEGNKQKEDAIRRKFAEKQKRIQIVQAIINTAQGVTAALGSAPPPANFILAALTAAAGAIQVAAIARQKFFKGGYTGGGQGRADETGAKPAGIVHEGEHVSPARIVRHPQEGKMVQYLESVRVGSPNMDLLKDYAKSRGILPDVSIHKPLVSPNGIPVLSGMTVQKSSARHIEIKRGRVDIEYKKLAEFIGEANDSEYKSEMLFQLLREQQNSNIQLRGEIAELRKEVKRLNK